MLQRLSMWGIATVILFASADVCGTRAQQPKAQPVSKAVYWATEEPEAEAYMVEKGDGDFRMVVVSKKDLKVMYHTSINSSVPVDKELMPVNSGGVGVRIYEFKQPCPKRAVPLSALADELKVAQQFTAGSRSKLSLSP